MPRNRAFDVASIARTVTALSARRNPGARRAAEASGRNAKGDARREHWSHFSRRLALCRELGIETLVIAGDIHGPLSDDRLGRVHVSLRQAAESAGEHDVRLALEFQSNAAFANNLQTAASLVAEVGSSALGLCFDAFHYYLGPSKFEDLAYLTAENLFHMQLSDLSGTPRELARACRPTEG